MGIVTSSFAWLDHSEKERRRMAEIISLFRDRDILDELGVGSIRDWALSELLFPGTSTVQTRARYLLFVPWTYLEIERQRISAAEVADNVRDMHVDLVAALTKGGERSSGVIGAQAGRNLRQLPNTIYWRGLRVFGIHQTTRTVEQYHRSLDGYYRALSNAPSLEGDERAIGEVRPNWDAVPPPPNRWRKKTTFDLRPKESEYLLHQIATQVPDSLLAFLVRRGTPVADIAAPWLDPDLAAYPERLRTQIDHARNFAQVMQGALLLYELLLAEAAGRDDLRDKHIGRLDEWHEGYKGALLTWDRPAFWTLVRSVNPSISPSTELFVERWADLVANNSEALYKCGAARTAIIEREHRLKRRLARLTNPEALKSWSGNEGATLFRYRWTRVKSIVGDILKGLGAPEEEAADA
ncbi:MAG: DUF6361 family protein [Actinomycetota bacterium]